MGSDGQHISEATVSGSLSVSGQVAAGRAAEEFLSGVDAMPSTRETYRKAIYIYLGWLAETGRDINSLTTVDILAYKSDLLEVKKKSALTVNLYLSVVRKFYKWTKMKGYYPDIADGVSSVKARSSTFRKMHLESEEGARLLEYEATAKPIAGGDNDLTRMHRGIEEMIAMRNFAMVNLMLRAGLRTIEVSRADVGDIVTKKGRRILKVWGKGHSEKDDFVVLTDEAFAPIEAYLRLRPGALPEDPLFACEGLDSKGRRISTRRIQAICKEGLRGIGLDGHEYSAHSLRHTTGTEILNNGGTMFDVQHVLRHATPATSQIYVNSIMEAKRLEEASERLLDKSFKKRGK